MYFAISNKLICIDLHTNEKNVVFESKAGDIYDYAIRTDGLIFVVYRTPIIDILVPNQQGMFELIREQPYRISTLKNQKIYLSDQD